MPTATVTAVTTPETAVTVSTPRATAVAGDEEPGSVDELFARAIEQSLADEQAEHVDPPGSPLHTHAEPGSAGDVLGKALEESLADEDFTIGGGYMESADTHGQTEGLTLGGGEMEESVYSGAQCDLAAPVRRYDIAAISVEITLNRFLDYDPEGRMYVLEDELARVRLEEAQNRAARADTAEPAVSIGLQGDAIQPLTIRANQGECLHIVLRNALNENEPTSLHVHGSSIYVADTGEPAIATNPDATILPGQLVAYEWMIAEDEQEGVHYLHSHGIDRFQASHGLFGGIIVEQQGSYYEDPTQSAPLASGWSAMIRHPDGSDFREFAIYYHEIGSERYRHRDKSGELVTFVDPFTGAYKPGGRALNYRSEPFMNRMGLQDERFDFSDKSMGYSSYTFGDPTTPIARSYLGDPVKTRIIHGGSEVSHVHHTHGGAIRWRRQPGTEDTGFDTGLDKSPSIKAAASTRIDSQSIGPSESYDLESECGSGGCQESVGDFLIHCHVAHHYLAGMWMVWRVHNTLQTGAGPGHGALPLRELPDRTNAIAIAVNSDALIGRTVNFQGTTLEITSDNLDAWVERQLPPQGSPIGYDASVLDWQRLGDTFVNEPETVEIWPNYRSDEPGVRLPILFEPTTGKLAYPLLRPHLGRRPPFAPNHGPAPYLSIDQQGRAPPQPGENGPRSLCPSGTRLKEFAVHAITVPILLNADQNLIDPVGQLFVLKENENAVRADNGLRVPLAIRANAGEDCVDIVLKSELKDTAENSFFSKVNIHTHLVQFDIQASDGVTTGFAYEQSVRPFVEAGETLQASVTAGSPTVELGSTARFQPGVLVGVGMDQDGTFEIKRIVSVTGSRITFEEPLEYNHGSGEIVSAEFVRYRWYPDVQFGTAYFHDHVDALVSWKHGLFGAIISEPPSSTYHDPFTNAQVRSGNVVDIHTESVVSPDVTGSFRELVMFIQDNNLTTHIGMSSGSSLSLRAEPLGRRGGEPSLWFSSTAHGDPATVVLNTYLGDPIVVRALVGGTNDLHTWHLDGHWFRGERFSANSKPISTVHLGISERYDLIIPAAGGPQRLPGDYLYHNGRTFKLAEGSWGIVRVHEGGSAVGLMKLPGREIAPDPAVAVCPRDAPLKEFSVSAIQAQLPMLGGETGKIFALASDVAAIVSGDKEPGPLVLHINVGDCVQARLSNELTEGRVSLHADMLAYDPKDSMGITAGFNPVQTIAPGESKTYTFFAHPEYGEGAALVSDWGNVLTNPGLGLYGAIIVGPEGATYTDPVTGKDLSLSSNWRADVQLPDGPSYRDFALFMQEQDPVIGTHLMPYSHVVGGVVGLNYTSAPLEGRQEPVPDTTIRWEEDLYEDPSTPILEAHVGDPVRIHVLFPFSEQNQVFSIEGHQWPLEPRMEGSDLLSSVQIGGLETLNIMLEGGAGGRTSVPGDYLYGNHRLPFREVGLWGLFRVYAKDDGTAGISTLGTQ
ncbi:MAG: multicopper oxidase domain-containing protein [SAR202 cluster bacterium]|nr:multicopper oxidase domain-containing protein [SAR202 cluster bacterium]